MAAPVDANRATTNITSAASPWTVNLPAGIVAGDTLVMFTRTGGNQTIASVTGWTFLVDDDTSDASDDNTCVWYRKADGAEGSTVSVTLSGTAKGAAITYRITGAEDPGLRAPQISAVAVGTGANADPPLVTPAGILKDYLFIVLGGLDGETQTFTAPTNYSNLASANSGTTGLATTNVVIGSATRQLTAYSEDPGTFTSGAPSGGWTAYTIVIHSPTPTAVGGGHFPPGRRMPRQAPPQAAHPGFAVATSISLSGLAHSRALGSIKVGGGLVLSGLVHSRALGSIKVGGGVVLSGLVHSRALGAPKLNELVFLSGLVHSRALGAIQINPTLILTGLVHSRALGAITVSVGPSTVFPTGLVHSRALGALVVSPKIPLTGLVHTRALGALQINPKVFLSGLVHSRALGAINVVQVIPLTGLVHSRALGALQINPKIPLSGLVHSRAIGNISLGGAAPPGAGHTHSINPHQHRDGDST